MTTAPPSGLVLTILPFDAQPIRLGSSNPYYNTTTNTWNYMWNVLGLKSGSQFIVFMDDEDGLLLSCSIHLSWLIQPLTSAFLTGRFTDGVSLIQTVDNSPNSSCLTTSASSTSSFFTLDPLMPAQCSPQVISWNPTRYLQPPSIRGFIPGGQAFDLQLPSSGQTWGVSIQEGTQMVILVRPMGLDQTLSFDHNARTSPLITVTGNSSQGNPCLNESSPSSTVILTSTRNDFTTTASTITAAITTLPEPTLPGKNVK